MSDEEDFDEFPSITVNSSIHESSSFSMPSAEELATQRAREEACEQELLRLRAEDHADTQSSQIMVSMIAHSDSSSSEGEAALAAAVGVLRVQSSPSLAAPSPSPSASPAPGMSVLLRVLRQGLPSAAAHLLDTHLIALETATDAQAVALTVQMAEGISTLVEESSTCVTVWEDEEALGVSAWLCAACVSPPPLTTPSTRRVLRRTLHLFLDEVATDHQMAQLTTIVSGAALGEGAALELSDALRAGGHKADMLAEAVLRAALARLASLPEPQVSLSAISVGLQACWRRLAPARQYLALQLLARLLPPPGDNTPPSGERGQGEGRGQGEREEARRLLAALLQATAHKEKTTDTLKVLVAASKLQVLFNLQHGTTGGTTAAPVQAQAQAQAQAGL